MEISDEDYYLAHYGVLRRSGRYPWGSGGPENASNKGFLDYVDQLKKSGMSESEVAKGLGVTTTQLRAAKSIAKNEQRQADIAMAQRLRDKGYGYTAIGERMGINESSVRALLAPGVKDRADVLQATASMLKDQVEQKQFLDIGSGVENHIGVSQTKLATAVAMLKEEGYQVHSVKIEQVGTGLKTEYKVLVKPGVTQKEAWQNRYNIQQISDHSTDGGRTFIGLQPPLSIASKRVAVRYAEDGGADADGVIYVRPGVKDISLGGAQYAQVRIAVNGTHYLKGMAVYKDDLPDGVDLMFNTNKSNTGNKLDAMKEMKRDADGNIDPANPFGAAIKTSGQLIEQKKDGSIRVTSVMNKVNEEGDWEKWSRNLSSQFLSKQSPNLARTQLDMTYERRKNELDEIMGLTNPAVRRKLLESYSDDVDSAAVHLKAAALPRQASHVIMPISSIKETEVYAPNYDNGDRVVLVRYPHGGTFEIPELTVNNKNKEAQKLLGAQARDAVGIHKNVAERLSGADFDGDTVLVIRNNDGKVKSSPALEGLKNFDPKAQYPAYDGMPKMKASTKQREMGNITNLIADMTIRGANTTELARAVRHSMVVIDAEKHNLNYKQSAIDNGIANLKEKYQGGKRAGASTLITKATSEARVLKRTPRPAADGGPIDKATGKLVFVPTGEMGKNGKPATMKSTKLAETDNAHTLSSGTPIERLYADHSNRLKALANQARKEYVSTKSIPYSPSAKAAYKTEVESLNAKLNIALKNRPIERQAQLLANAMVAAKRRSNPDMDPDELKKVKGQALEEARLRTGAKKEQIVITDKEWAAIQSGAISNNKLEEILRNADIDQVKKLATPRTATVMSKVKQDRAKQMLSAGYTQAEVAKSLGVPVSTLVSSVVK